MNTGWALQLVHCLTPLHNGAGQGLGSVDRPIMRERTTEFPFVQSSTIKGAALAAAEAASRQAQCTTGGPFPAHLGDLVRSAAFGEGGDTGNQGCIVLGDASILLFPVRSLCGTFAWVTSALPLARLQRSLGVAGVTPQAPGDLPTALRKVLDRACPHAGPGRAVGCARPDGQAEAEAWDADIRIARNGDYCLEGLVLPPTGEAEPRAAMAALARSLAALLFEVDDSFWPDYFSKRLVLLSQDDFKHLVTTATQIEANIKINDETGVTQGGSLRSTEYLPAETVLASLVAIEQPRTPVAHADVRRLAGAVLDGVFQLGADESKGKGVVVSHLHALTPTQEA